MNSLLEEIQNTKVKENQMKDQLQEEIRSSRNEYQQLQDLNSKLNQYKKSYDTIKNKFDLSAELKITENQKLRKLNKKVK